MQILFNAEQREGPGSRTAKRKGLRDGHLEKVPGGSSQRLIFGTA